MRKDLSLLGAATDLGQGKAGTELAPSWLRVKGLQEALSRKFYSVKDLGDITPQEKPEVQGHDHKAISLYNKRLRDICSAELAQGRTLLNLGGDHSVAIGTLAGSLTHNPNSKVVWVDAHADLNTPQTSPSGNVHGMPLAFFFKLVQTEPTKSLFDWVPHLPKENLVYIGLRDVDAGERKFIKDLGITSYYAEDVLELGIDKVLQETVAQLCPTGTEPLHLSFDVDGLDPKFVPATGTPVPGGLHLMDGQKIINTLARESHLISFDLVEVNPLLGQDKKELDMTAASIAALLDALPTWNERSTTLDQLMKEKVYESRSLEPEV